MSNKEVKLKIIKMGKKLLITFCGLIVLLSSCAQSRLQDAIISLDESCPKHMSEEMILTSVKLRDDFVIFSVNHDELTASVDKFKRNGELMKSMTITMLSGNRDFIKLLLSENKGCKYIYTGLKSGATCTVEISAKELKDAEKMEATPDSKLRGLINLTNIQLPITIDEGFVFTEVYVKGNNVLFRYEVDETILDLSEIENNQEQLKEILLAEMQSSQDVEKRIMQIAAESGKNLLYLYVGKNSGKTVSIIISNSEIKKIL